MKPTNIVCRPPIDRPESARPRGSLRTLYCFSTSGITCWRSSRSKAANVSSTCRGWLRWTTWLLGMAITIGTAFPSASRLSMMKFTRPS